MAVGRPADGAALQAVPQARLAASQAGLPRFRRSKRRRRPAATLIAKFAPRNSHQAFITNSVSEAYSSRGTGHRSKRSCRTAGKPSSPLPPKETELNMRHLRPLLLSTFLGAGVLAVQLAPAFAQATGCPPVQGDLGAPLTTGGADDVAVYADVAPPPLPDYDQPPNSGRRRHVDAGILVVERL